MIEVLSFGGSHINLEIGHLDDHRCGPCGLELDPPEL